MSAATTADRTVRGRSGPRRISCLLTVIVSLAAVGCTSGGGTAAAPAASASATPLPPGLAAATGWLAYGTGDIKDRIHVSRINGSDDHEIATELAGETSRADFSHDGRMAFSHYPPGGVHNVYVAKADGTHAGIIAECQRDICFREFPAWSPDSQRLATVTYFGPGDEDVLPDDVGIAVIDIATQAVQVILRHSTKEFQDGLVRWSPDGRRLAFYRWHATPDGSASDASIWVINADGTGLKQLTPWDLKCGDPDWSRDGTQIICDTAPPPIFPDGKGNIYAVNADGSGEPRALTTYGAAGPRAAHPRFTPDGRYILYIRCATTSWNIPPRHIYALDPTTGNSTPVLTTRTLYGRPSLQPTP